MTPRWDDETIPVRVLTDEEMEEVRQSGYVMLPSYFDEKQGRDPGWYYMGKRISESEARRIFEENDRPFPDINAV